MKVLATQERSDQSKRTKWRQNVPNSDDLIVSLVVWLGYNLPVMKAVGRALRRIPPTPTYTVNRALGRWTDPGPMSAFATRDPIHIVHSTLRINPNMFMFMFMLVGENCMGV